MSMQLQPKIKQHQECGVCGTSPNCLPFIEVFDTPKYEDSEQVANEVTAKKDLCGHCVVGRDVPVCRQSEGWEFGEVTRYDSSKLTRPFLVSFPDGSEEWVDISRRPPLDYLAFIRSTAQTQRAAGAIEHLDWLDKFTFNGAESSPQMPASLSTFSSSSSIGTFEPIAFGSSIFPLFNDDKLFDVENLAFVDEDVDMQDSFVESTQDSSEASEFTESEDIVMKPPMKRKATTIRAVRAPKHWTKQEDQLLMKIMNSFHEKGIKPKWPDVADQIPTRNGKQCRERYVNHLSSALKPKIWDPNEDALIMHLFFKHGTKWSQICRQGFVGRTDNGIKNRFHHLRRWLEKDYRKRFDSDDESMSSGEDMATSIHQKIQRMIAAIASESKAKGGAPTKGKYKFGKFKKVKRVTSCKRCCLLVPSAHTGVKICTVTGWCEACASIPSYVMGDDLRACLTQRMALDDFMLE